MLPRKVWAVILGVAVIVILGMALAYQPDSRPAASLHDTTTNTQYIGGQDGVSGNAKAPFVCILGNMEGTLSVVKLDTGEEKIKCSTSTNDCFFSLTGVPETCTYPPTEGYKWPLNIDPGFISAFRASYESANNSPEQ